MKSSTLDFIRSLVLLGFMVTVPAAAIFGAARFNFDRLNSWNRTIDAERTSLIQAQSPSTFESERELPLSSQKPAEFRLSPLYSSAEEDPNAWDYLPEHRHEKPAGQQDLYVLKTSYQERKIPEKDSDFESIQQRLRQLGADYYRLETSGENIQLFHFSCHFNTSNQNGRQKIFQAVSEDPLVVMKKVLTEIELWRKQDPENR